MSLKWSWKDYWAWFDQIETSDGKAVAIRELNKDGWLGKLAPEIQVDVMEFAPDVIIDALAKFPNVFSNRALYLIIQKRNKRNKRR